ncbi:MAG: DUF1893 domain-containing protein [Candidatus Micrarchaeota archaeon]
MDPREFADEAYPLIVRKGDKTYTFVEHTLKPLVKALDLGIVRDAYVFDCIVGAAAAKLYLLQPPRELYCETISEPAYALLSPRFPLFAEKYVSKITREDGKPCKMEELSSKYEKPEEFLKALKEKVSSC